MTICPSHQYEVAHTSDNPVLYPAFLERNHMVTRVLAKTTKVKNNFINGKKKFKRILSCLFGGRRNLRVTNLPSRTSSLLSVLLRTRSAQCLSSQHFAAVVQRLRPSGVMLACVAGEPGSISTRRGNELFFSCFFLTFLFFI